MNTKKTISPVVATALLIVVAVVAVVSFQGWFGTFSSKLFSDTETQSNGGSLSTKIETIKDGTLYFNNQFSENVTIQEIKIGNRSCSNVSGAYETGVNEINVRNCLGDITSEVAKDIVVVTDKGVYQKKEFLDLFTNYCTLDGVRLRTGENYTFYSAQIALDCSVLTQTRFCDNGELNGSSIYAYSSCDLSTFRSVWNTSKNSIGSSPINNVVLPLEASGTYNFIAYWGDGTNSTITAYNDVDNNHTYATPGVYQINITGTITGFRFNNAGDNLKLTEIKEWGPLRLGNNGGYFNGASNMQITATDILNMSGTTSMAQAFRFTTSLTTVPSMNDWDMSQVITMYQMFQTASSFNQDIGNWDVGNVTIMAGMFQNANSFNQNISNWNTSKVTNTGSMFFSASSFNQDIGNWDVGNVNDMSSMFKSASSFNQDINNWNVGNVTIMYEMFEAASSFNQSLNNWDVSKVTNMYSMFRSMNNFNQDLNNWNTSNVIVMSWVFQSSPNFNGNISNWNTSNVTNMGALFWGASSFNQSLASWDVDQVTFCGSFNVSTPAWTQPKPTFTSCTP